MTICLFKPDLFLALDTMKVVILSVALTAPGLFVPYFISVVSAKIICSIYPEAKENLGSHLDWFAVHAMINAFSFYLAIAVAYFLSLQFRVFLWIIIFIIMSTTLFEAKRMALMAKEKIAHRHFSSDGAVNYSNGAG